MIGICWHVYIGGETPQTPLSVFDVGYGHNGGIPPSLPQIGGDPQTPLSISQLYKDNIIKFKIQIDKSYSFCTGKSPRKIQLQTALK